MTVMEPTIIYLELLVHCKHVDGPRYRMSVGISGFPYLVRELSRLPVAANSRVIRPTKLV
jgi:hypothetical protein